MKEDLKNLFSKPIQYCLYKSILFNLFYLEYDDTVLITLVMRIIDSAIFFLKTWNGQTFSSLIFGKILSNNQF